VRPELERFFAAVTGGAAIEDIDRDFVGTAALPAAARLRIYADMYLVRLLDTLAEQFPDLLAAVGRPAFGRLARGYLAAHPPTSPSLRELGAALPAYLADQPELAALALLEWTRVDLFDGPDGVPLRWEELCAVPPAELPGLELALGPTCRILPGPRLVYRTEGGVHDRLLDEWEARALALLEHGRPVGALCEHAATFGVTAERLLEVLAGWVEDGLITAIRHLRARTRQ
jgi:hypothetical protein